jgi:phosphoenolpyruvate synthase/pyruvate phosphate dikinase
MVDYLSPSELRRHLSILEDARLYAEQIFRNSEDFLEEFFNVLAKENHYPKHVLLATTAAEIEDYWKRRKLPNIGILAKRFNQSALVVKKARGKLFYASEVKQVKNVVLRIKSDGILYGQVAYKGKAVGVVKIITNPIKDGAKFKKGDILVTGMTRPEFLALMKKASAFVTDAGGILSHAAIVARELKKPCLIGTKHATAIFKDGDRVEVDANKGIVRKL